MLSANQINDIKLQAFAGEPSILPGVCKIYPLTCGQIIRIGDTIYRGRLGTLLLTETEIAKIIKDKTGEDKPLEDIDPLNYILQSADLDDSFFLELKIAFATFIKEDIMFLPELNSILIGPKTERRLITSKNFRDFQDILRIQNKKPIKEPPPENESPGERKMRLLAERRDEVKRKQAEKAGEGQTFQDLLEIASVFGIDYKNETILALYNLINRHQLKEKWDQDIQMLCAGADSSKIKTQYWGESSNKK